MYAILICYLDKEKGSLGSTGQTTKLHLILAATFKKSGSSQFNIQNYTDFECLPYQLILFIREKGQQVPGDKLLNYTYFLQQPWKKSGGPQVKLQNYTDFECMPYHLIIFIREKGHYVPQDKLLNYT